MTKFLANVLKAKEPFFSSYINKLESLHGHPSEDIKLTLAVNDQVKHKISQLGLDRHDTKEEELFNTLQLKIKHDDDLLTRQLRTLAATKISAEANLMSGLKLVLNDLDINTNCYALKKTKLKTLLKSNSPKKTSKLLGYRSVDSMLKREDIALVYMSALNNESKAWQIKFSDQLKKLKQNDFEIRAISLIDPRDLRWQKYAATYLKQNANSVISIPLIGTVVLLPVSYSDLPDGAAVASMYLSLLSINEIYVVSSYLQYYQFSKKFSDYLLKANAGNLEFSTSYFDKKLPWHLLHKLSSFTYVKRNFLNDDPLEILENTNLIDIEKCMAKIAPNLNYWIATSHLGYNNGGQTVSLNIMDNAVSLANKLNIKSSYDHFLKSSLWQQLLLRYFSHDSFLNEVSSQGSKEMELKL